MKLKAPVDCRSISIGSRVMIVDDDGCVEVDEPDAETLVAHGFTLTHNENPSSAGVVSSIDVSTLSRRELFRVLKEHQVAFSLPVTNEALRELARQALKDSSGERRHI